MLISLPCTFGVLKATRDWHFYNLEGSLKVANTVCYREPLGDDEFAMQDLFTWEAEPGRKASLDDNRKRIHSQYGEDYHKDMGEYIGEADFAKACVFLDVNGYVYKLQSRTYAGKPNRNSPLRFLGGLF